MGGSDLFALDIFPPTMPHEIPLQSTALISRPPLSATVSANQNILILHLVFLWPGSLLVWVIANQLLLPIVLMVPSINKNV